MKLVTIGQAKKMRIFRRGDVVDLTEIIHPERERLLPLQFEDTGIVSNKVIRASKLTWFYDWNTTIAKPVLVGLPSKQYLMQLKGKKGFINGPKVIDRTVNFLYANNKIGIYGRQITEEDYQGLMKKEFDEQTPFEKMMADAKDIESTFSGTPFVSTILGGKSFHKYECFGFKKIKFNPFDITTPVLDECLYSTNIMEAYQNILFAEKENIITISLFPILYGKIDELLVDISEDAKQQKVWKLYKPEEKSEEC